MAGQPMVTYPGGKEGDFPIATLGEALCESGNMEISTFTAENRVAESDFPITTRFDYATDYAHPCTFVYLGFMPGISFFKVLRGGNPVVRFMEGMLSEFLGATYSIGGGGGKGGGGGGSGEGVSAYGGNPQGGNAEAYMNVPEKIELSWEGQVPNYPSGVGSGGQGGLGGAGGQGGAGGNNSVDLTRINKEYIRDLKKFHENEKKYLLYIAELKEEKATYYYEAFK